MPNWLGDMVMASAFVKAVRVHYQNAEIDLIVKKELASVAEFIQGIQTIHSFDKKTTSSLKFGKQLQKVKNYDLFFCLPNSFSSAQMAFATGAKKRIGYKKELRSFLLTDSYKKPKGIHRVDEYLQLLCAFTRKENKNASVALQASKSAKRNAIVVNVNSEAQSRRLPIEKAVNLLNELRNEINEEIILIGSKKEKEQVTIIFNHLADKSKVTNLAGATSLPETIKLFSGVKAVITTDSGPAHVANATGTPAIVLFGAGDENNTAPYNKTNLEIIRLGKLECEKCLSNTCKKFNLPHCLVQLENEKIIAAVKKYL